jgi:hypothetical protein
MAMRPTATPSANTIEVYRDMGSYVLCRTVEARGGRVFMRMRKITRREDYTV